MAGSDPSVYPECVTRMTAQLGIGQEEISVVFQPRPEVLALFN
jgi:hypothetical protein